MPVAVSLWKRLGDAHPSRPRIPTSSFTSFLLDLILSPRATADFNRFQTQVGELSGRGVDRPDGTGQDFVPVPLTATELDEVRDLIGAVPSGNSAQNRTDRQDFMVRFLTQLGPLESRTAAGVAPDQPGKHITGYRPDEMPAKFGLASRTDPVD